MRTVNIHASCVRIGRAGAAFGANPKAGAMLLGESGAGKSTLALRLIGRGAELVADDRAELFARNGSLWCRSPAALAGLIEARGLGIVKIGYVREAEIALAVELVAANAVARVPEPAFYAPPEALLPDGPARLPLLRLCAFDAAAPEKIALAVADALFSGKSNPP